MLRTATIVALVTAFASGCAQTEQLWGPPDEASGPEDVVLADQGAGELDGQGRVDDPGRTPEDTWDFFDFFLEEEREQDKDKKEVLTDWLPPKEVKETVPEEIDEGLKVKDLQTAPESKECAVAFGSQLIMKDVVLAKVVVTAPVFAEFIVQPEQLDGFYVADSGGGVFAGIQAAFKSGNIPKIAPGTVLTLSGDYKEAQCYSVFFAKSVLVEQESGEEVVPVKTSPEEIAADPEQFEGVLVKITDVTVTSANPDEAEGWDNQEFQVNGTLRVGNDYALPYMNKKTDERKVGDVFAYIVGMLRYKDGEFRLMPRIPSDMIKEGEVPPEEEPEKIEELPDVKEEPPEVVEEVLNPEPDIVEQIDEYEVIADVPEDVPDEPDVGPDTMPDIPSQPDSPIVITEIMYDPDGGIADEKGEWFEIFNAGDEALDINGWRLTDETGEQHILQFGMPFALEPGEFFVLGSNSIESTNGGVEIGYQYPYSDFKLENKVPDAIILLNIFGEPVDSVHFGTKLGFPAAKGASLVLVHPNLDNENPDNWKVATTPYGDESNKGTPWAP